MERVKYFGEEGRIGITLADETRGKVVKGHRSSEGEASFGPGNWRGGVREKLETLPEH